MQGWALRLAPLVLFAACTRFGFNPSTDGTAHRDFSASDGGASDALAGDGLPTDDTAFEAGGTDGPASGDATRDAGATDGAANDASVVVCEDVCPGTCVEGTCRVSNPVLSAVTCPDGIP